MVGLIVWYDKVHFLQIRNHFLQIRIRSRVLDVPVLFDLCARRCNEVQLAAVFCARAIARVAAGTCCGAQCVLLLLKQVLVLLRRGAVGLWPIK